MERSGGHDSGSSSTRVSGNRGGGSRTGGSGGAGGGGGGGGGDNSASKSHHHHQRGQQQHHQDSPGQRGKNARGAERKSDGGKVTTTSPLAGFGGVGGEGGGENGSPFSLKDAVLAAQKAQNVDARDAGSRTPRRDRERDKSQPRKETPQGRSQSEGATSKETPKTSPGERAASQDSKASKGRAASEEKSVGKGKSSSGNARSKNAKSSEQNSAGGNTGRSPGRLKKSLSTDWDAGSSSHSHTARSKDANSSPHKTPPRAKRKLSRGHTVHDVNEYGELLDKQAVKDGSRTSRQSSPAKDLRSGGGKKEQSNHMSRNTSSQGMSPEVSNKSMLSLSKHLPSSFLPSSRQSSLQTQLLPELTQQSSFFSLNKVPSRSSTSSDVQSEVCVDLPDYTELPAIHDVHSTERDRDHQDLQVKLGFPVAPYRRLHRVGTERWPCLSLLGTCFVLLVSLALFLPVLLLVLVLVPLCLFVKCLCSLCCCCGLMWGRCCISCCYTHLSSSERLWVQGSAGGGGGSGGRLVPVAQSIIVLQRGLSTDRLRNLLDTRLLSLENRHGRRVYPRFTQRVVSFCCGYAWVPDDNFFINNHVFNMPGYIESLEDLQDHVAKMASEHLSMDHPLWEIQVLHNFREPRDTVLLFRVHLAMADGTSLVRILENAIVDTQKASQPKAGFGVEAANMSPLKAFFMGPVTFCRRYLFRKSDFNLLHGRHVHPCGEMAVAWSEPFSLSAAVRVKQVARCTLSELLISVVAGNMRTYMQVNGISHPYNINCALPVDFRSDYPTGGTVSGTGGNPVSVTEVGNHFSMAVVPLATNTEGAIPRLWETKLRLEKFKSSPEAAIISGAHWFTCCVLPVSACQRLWNRIYSRCTCLVANLAGPESSLKLDSREIKCMLYWVPPLEQVAITISFLTYADQVRMAVISDRAVLPNPELLTRDFIYKLETMSKLLAHRRIPGEQLSSRIESMHMLSSYTLDDLTSEQIQLQMTLVQQELHDMKLQLEAGSSHRLTANDTQLCQRIEQLKERSRELLMHLRKRRAAEAENAIILSEEDELLDSDSDRQRPFRRRTLSMSSKMSTASVSSTMRPLSTASLSNQPSPSHPGLPPWSDFGGQDGDRFGAMGEGSVGGTSGPGSKKHGYNYRQRLSTMEEFEMDESLIISTTDARKCNTY